MTTPTDTTSTARRQVHLDTLETIAEQVGEFELAIAGPVSIIRKLEKKIRKLRRKSA